MKVTNIRRDKNNIEASNGKKQFKIRYNIIIKQDDLEIRKVDEIAYVSLKDSYMNIESLSYDYISNLRIYPKEKLPKVEITYIDQDNVSLRFSGMGMEFDKKIDLEHQGDSSRSYPVKNYEIEMFSENEEKYKVKFKDWPASNTFHLKANYVDSSAARNISTARLVNESYNNVYTIKSGKSTIDGFPIEFYMNRKFRGIYTWNLKQNKNLFNMNEGYIYRAKTWSDNVMFVADTENTLEGWDCKYPKNNDDNSSVFRVIEWVKQSSDDEFKNNIHQYFDLDYLLTYFIWMNVGTYEDNIGKNMTLISYDGLKWIPTMYDLDSGFGIQWNGQEYFNVSQIIGSNNNLFDKLYRNFENEIKLKYAQLRNSIITKENILEKFNETIGQIPSELYEKDREYKYDNFPIYNILETDDIKYIEQYLDKRLVYLDSAWLD